MSERFKYVLSIDYSEAEKQLNDFVARATERFTQLAQTIQQSFNSSVEAIRNQAKQAATDLKNTLGNIGFSRARTDIERLARELARIQQSLRSTTGISAEGAQTELEGIVGSLRSYSAILKQTSKAFQEPISAVKNVVNSLARETSQVKGVMTGFIDQFRQAYSITNLIKGAMASFGVVFGAYGIVQAFRQSVLAVSEFDRSMRQVWTLLRASEQEFNRFKEEVLELSRTVPLSTSEIARGIYWALSAGVPKDNVIEFVGQAAKAAVAGLTSLKNAVDVITTAMNAYGYSASEVTRITDILFRATSLAKTTFEDLVTTIGPTIPIAAQLNVGLDELASALGTLANMGISTARAATYINQALVNILSPSVEAKETANQLGLQFNAAAMQAMGFANYLKYLKDMIGDNEEAIANLFGNVRAMRAVFSLTSEQGLKLFNDMLKEVQNSAGATEVAARKMTDALSYQAQRFKNIWGSLVKSEEFRGFLAGLMNAVNTVSAAITGFSEGSGRLTTVNNVLQRTLSDMAASASSLSTALSKLQAAQKFVAEEAESVRTRYVSLQTALIDFYNILGISYIQRNSYIDLSNEEKRILKDLQASYPALAESLALVGDAYTFNKEKVLAFLQAQIKAIEQQVKYLELMKLQRKQYISELQLSSKEAEMRLRDAETRRQQVQTTIELYGTLEQSVKRASEAMRAAIASVGVSDLGAVYKTLDKYWQDPARVRLTTQQRQALDALGEAYRAILVNFFEQFFDQLGKTELFKKDSQLIERLSTVRTALIEAATKSYDETAGFVDAAWRIYKKQFDEIFKNYSGFFEQMPVEFRTILQEYVDTVIKPHKAFADVLKAISTGEINVAGAVEKLEKDRQILDYQMKALWDQLEYAKVAQETSEESISLVDETVELTKQYIATLTQQMREISERSAEEVAVEGALRYIQSQLETVLFKRSSLLTEVSRATKTTVTSFSQVTEELFKNVRDKTLEEFAKQFTNKAEQLLEGLRQVEGMLTSVDLNKLSAQSRATYNQMLKLVRSEIEGLKAFVEVLDVSDLVSKYSAKEYRDIETWLKKTYENLFKDFGIDMGKLLAGVPRVGLEPALDAFKESLRGEIDKTKIVEPATASRIAEGISDGLAQYAQRLAAEMSQTYRDAVREIEALPTISEKLRRLWETRQKIPVEKAQFVSAAVAVLGPYLAELVAEQIFSPAMQTVQDSFTAILQDSLKQGLNTLLVLEQAGIEKVAIQEFIAGLWAEYKEKVTNFQTQVREKYKEVFGTEAKDVKTALEKILEQAAKDEAIAVWLQQLETLRTAIVQVASSLELLGEKVDVTQDVGGFLLSLSSTVRESTNLFEKFESVLGSFFAMLDLTKQTQVADVLDKLDRLRSMFDMLRNDAVRPLVAALTNLYTNIYTGSSTFEMFADELAKIGITSQESLTNVLVTLRQFSEATDLFASALFDALRETSRLASKFEELTELQPISPEKLFVSERYTIQGLLELIQSSEKSLQQYSSYYEQMLKMRDYLVQRYSELPAELQSTLSNVVDVLTQLVGNVSERAGIIASKLTAAKEQAIQILTELWQGALKLVQEAETTVKGAGLEEIIDLFNKLSKIDVTTIPLDQVIEGVTGYELRERVRGALDFVEKALDANIKQFAATVKNKIDQVSLYKLARSYLETFDWEALSKLIIDSLTDPSIETLKTLIEKIEDAQLREQYRTVLESLIESTAEGVKNTFADVFRAITSGRFELIPEDDALKAIEILKALDEQLGKIIQHYEEAGLVADDFIEMQLGVQKKIEQFFERWKTDFVTSRKEQYQEEMTLLENYVAGALKLMQLSSSLSVEEIKRTVAELNTFLLSGVARLSSAYSEMEEDIATRFERMLQDIEETSGRMIQNIIEEMTQSIEDGFETLEKMFEQLDLANFVHYLEQLAALREQIELLAGKIESVGLTKSFADELERLEEHYERLRQIDLGKMIRAETLFDSMLKLDQLLRLIANNATLVEKIGLDLNSIYSQFAEQLFEWVTSPASITQVFQQTILKPLNEAMVRAWVDAWREGIEEGKIELEGLVGALQALIEIVRKSPAEVLRYSAAVVLTLADDIVGMFEKLNVISNDVGNALRSAVEGAMAGWNIAGVLAKVVNSTVLGIFPIIGSILGVITSLITGTLSEQFREQEELRRKIEAARDSLASSFRSAIERAFSESNVESFAMRVRQSLYSAVRDALIRAFFDRYVTQLIDPLLSALLGPEGQIDISQINWEQVRANIEAIVGAASEFFEYLRQLLPELEAPTGREWTPPSAVATITEETANRLIGLFTTLTVEVRTIRQIIEKGVRVYVVSTGAQIDEYFRR